MKGLILFTVFAISRSIVTGQTCTQTDPAQNYLCRQGLLDLYLNMNSGNMTALALYQQSILDLFMDTSRPDNYFYELGRQIFNARYPNLWDSLWYPIPNDGTFPRLPCQSIQSILQYTFSEFGGISAQYEANMVFQLITNGFACSLADPICPNDYPILTSLIWSDPPPIGNIDIGPVWANSNTGASLLLDQIQTQYTWSGICPEP